MKVETETMEHKIDFKDLKNMRLGVYGFGRTGRSLVKQIAPLAQEIIVYEDSKEVEEKLNEANWPDNVNWEFRALKIDEQLDFLITSPGIAADNSLLNEARKQGLDVIGELELAWRLCRGNVWAITGTNGKSTCVELAGAFLRSDSRNEVDVCGNVGRPMIEAVFAHGAEKNVDYVVEVSSFQVEGMNYFVPDNTLLSNLGDDHQDRHNSIDEYHALKWELVGRTRTQGRVVLPEKLRSDFVNKIENRNYENIFFNSTGLTADCGIKLVEDGLELTDGVLLFEELPYILRLFPENLLAVMAFVGVEPTVQAVKSGLAEFTPLPHRAQQLPVDAPFKIINDSKGTNPHAVFALLERVDTPLRLVLGGGDKASDFETVFEQLANKKVKRLLLCGEPALVGRLGCLADKYEIDYQKMRDWELAVKRLVKEAEPGETVLLSPGATSFDAFKNYRERGEKFHCWVREVIAR